MSQATEIRPPADLPARAPAPAAERADPDGACATRSATHERHRRHILELLAVSSLGLVAWTVMLGFTLPSDYRVHAWRTTWVGFDVLLLGALAATAILAWRRHRAALVTSVATAVLLVCDAWFDVSLDFGTPGVWASAALAAFVELPIAGFLLHRVYSLLQLKLAAQQHAERPEP
jgi:hypothetical protein